MAIHCCKDCYVQFKNTSAYLNHRRKIHPRFSCSNCGKVFGLRKKFKNHTRACWRVKKCNKENERESMVGLSDYKRLPVVTAEELDTQFKIYIDRKFGKKGVFRNEKMCKFCSKVFAIASDFADHIREHYNTIPLDATGVKSKFDFMTFMGLKIREANDTDYHHGNTKEHSDRMLANKITECKVVVLGERCNICDEPFKCITDLNLHIKKQHYQQQQQQQHRQQKKHRQQRRSKVMLVLRIGDEIISKIPLRRRHIRRSTEIQSKSRRLNNEENEIHKAEKYGKSLGVNDGRTEVARSRGESSSEDRTYGGERSWEFEERNNSQPAMRSEKEWGSLFFPGKKINERYGNTIRCLEARGNKFGEVRLDSVDEARSAYGLYEAGSTREDKGTYELDSREMYADEYFENAMQFAESWKDEISNDHLPWWYSTAVSETEARQRIEDEKNDDDNCFCIEADSSRLLAKENSSAWEKEHLNMLDHQDSRNINGLSTMRNYSTDFENQTEFSVPSDEESYDFQIETAHELQKNSEDDLEDSSYGVRKPGEIISGHNGTIVAEKGRTNLSANYPRSFPHPSEDKPFIFQEHRILGASNGALNPINEHSGVFIKEEIILDDFICCADDDYSSSSNLSA